MPFNLVGALRILSTKDILKYITDDFIVKFLKLITYFLSFTNSVSRAFPRSG